MSLSDGLKLILALGFGGVVSILMIYLFHIGEIGGGILCLIIVFLAWLFDNETSGPIIAVVLLAGGLIECFLLGKIFLGIFLIVLACASFFVPKILS